ncbi:MAG: T9SS type A sorting domain-containing protein [Opitutaceae bacterium]|nr:T9SS type A sorting domain-containing protein [Cytophagales bacterium]
MKKALLITSLLTASAFASMAQTEYVKQYFYTAGGNFMAKKNMVKVAVLLDTKIKVIDSVYGDFSNFAEIFYDAPGKRYIGTAHIGRASGKDLLVRYDLDTYDRIDSISVNNVQAIDQNATKLIVAKAFINNSVYVDIYNAKTGKLVTEVYGISNNCKDIKIFGDSAFVANSLPKVSNPYADSLGYISIVKISTGMLSNSINVGEKAAGIDNLIIRKEMDNRLHIYFTSNQDSVMKETGNLVIHSLKKSAVVEVDNDNIYSFDNSQSNVSLARRTKDGLKKTTIPTTIPTDIYANTFYFDRTTKNYLTLVSDFATKSNLDFYSIATGQSSFTIDLGTSVAALKPDYRPGFPTGLAIGSAESSFTVFPNPFKDQFTIQNTNNAYQNWEILNVDGIIIASGEMENFEERISTENFSKGMYLLNLRGNNISNSIKIIKQ